MRKKKYKDIEIGDKFGNWIVIDKGAGRYYSNGKNKGKSLKRTWICKCICGKCNSIVDDVVEKLLKNGSSTGCRLSYPRKTKTIQYKNLTGKTFGRLTVKEFYKKEGRNVLWVCECSCGSGKLKIASTQSLTSGDCKSCGCLFEIKNRKHNLTNTRIHRIYQGIKERCYNPNHTGYKNYGGKGIIICDEWLDKENGLINFYNWSVKNGYSDNLTIDRINSNGNYEPNNCRWTTNKVQMNNRNNNVILTVNGESKTIAEWSDITGIKHTTIRMRIIRGWSHERAIFNYCELKGLII